MPPLWVNAYNLYVPRKQPNQKLKSYLETRTKPENCVKIVQTSDA